MPNCKYYTFLKLREGFKIVLSGLQQTNFPTAYTKNDAILQEYMKLIHKSKSPIDRRIKTRDFIGPSSISLELPNISPPTGFTFSCICLNLF